MPSNTAKAPALVAVCHCNKCKRSIVPARYAKRFRGTLLDVVQCPVCRTVLNADAPVTVVAMEREAAFLETGFRTKIAELSA